MGDSEALPVEPWGVGLVLMLALALGQRGVKKLRGWEVFNLTFIATPGWYNTAHLTRVYLGPR